MIKNQKSKTRYLWSGTNKKDQFINGEIEARSLIVAKIKLHNKGINIKKIAKNRKPLFDRKFKKITLLDISTFSRQLATMINAGIPIIQSFEIIAKGQSNNNMKNLLYKIKNDIESGLTLTESLQKYPLYFNELFCNLIDVGEKSGTLDIMLDKIANYKEKTEIIKNKIKKTLRYPISVMIIAILVTTILLIFVVPQFELLFKGFGAEIPAFTSAIVSLSQLFQNFWYIIFSLISLAIYIFNYAHKKRKFKNIIDNYLLKTPIIGKIIRNASIARFSRTLSISYAAGLPLINALIAVAGATGNNIFSKATLEIKEEISSGLQLHKAIEKTNLFTNMVVQMVAIGEESGTLEFMLNKVANFYEEAVENSVDSLGSLLEPIIMTILGLLVGSLVIAMYLPIFKLGTVI